MIAISYRRDDSQSATGRLYDCLRMEFGFRNVFRDFDSIPYGSDFRQHIQEVLSHSEAMVVVIGSEWLGTRPDGTHRLNDPGDIVCLEIATALEQKITVFPVLLDDTRMPEVENLPEKLKQLRFKNALRVDTGADFHFHVRRLVHALRGLNLKLYTSGRRGKLALVAAALSCIMVTCIYVAYQSRTRNHTVRIEPELRYFLERFVAAGNSETGEAEAECYTEPAALFFGEVNATHDKIRELHVEHASLWPTSFYRTKNEPLVLALKNNEYMIQINILFTLANKEFSREGEDAVFLHIKRIAGKFKIYCATEFIVRDDKRPIASG
jgi:TIR domain